MSEGKMGTERLPGFDDVYSYIDSQFLDVPKKEEQPGRRAVPPRARPPFEPPDLPPARGRLRERKEPPPPVPSGRKPAQPEARQAEPPPESRTEEPREPIQEPPKVEPRPIKRRPLGGNAIQMRIPDIEDYLPSLREERPRPGDKPKSAVVRMEVKEQAPEARPAPKPRPSRQLKRPELSKPRPRRKTNMRALQELEALPNALKHVDPAQAAEKARTLSRIANPELSLEDTADLLGVCTATVRRYTNKGWLRHHRTKGNQRRFFLADVVEFLEEFGHKKLP